jgi:hypothetical protein
MKRMILALALLAGLVHSALAADVSYHGIPVACNDSTQEVTLAPPGWHPPMQLPAPRMCDTDTYNAVKWLFQNESPVPEIWLTDTDTPDGVFDSWSYY